MAKEVPPLAEEGMVLEVKTFGIWDPHGNPAGGPPLQNKGDEQMNKQIDPPSPGMRYQPPATHPPPAPTPTGRPTGRG